MILKKIFKSAIKFKGWGKKSIPITGKLFGKNFRQYLDVLKPTFEKGAMKRMWNIGKWGGRIGGGMTGATAGGFAGSMFGPIGAAVGAGTGGLIGGGGVWAGSKIAKGMFFSAMKHPGYAFTAGMVGTSAYAFGKPLLGSALREQNLNNRPTNPAIPGGRTVGPGYITLGNQARRRMSGNNLGATGDLTLSLRTLRHGRR